MAGFYSCHKTDKTFLKGFIREVGFFAKNFGTLLLNTDFFVMYPAEI